MPVDYGLSQKALDQTEFQSNFWKPKAGPDFVDNFIRITPPHAALENRIFLGTSLHWPPDGVTWPAFLCPRNMFGGVCPICNSAFAELKRLKGEMDEKSARDAVRHYWPGWTFYFSIVLLNKDGTVADETPKILSANKDLSGLLMDLSLDTDGCPACEGEEGDHLSSCLEIEDENARRLDFTDIEEGFDVNIRAKVVKVSFGDRDGIKHDYIVKKKRNPSTFDHPEILSKISDPTTLNPQLDVEAIQALLSSENQLLIGAPQGEAADPLAVKADEAPKAEDDGWGGDDSKEAPEPETGKETGTTEQAAEPPEEPPAAKQETAAAKKKRLAEEKKAAADAPPETEDEMRQRLREELTKTPQ